MKTLIKRYSNVKPIGTKHLTNTSGLALFEPLEDDKFDCEYISACWEIDKGYTNFRKCTVHYTMSGRAYIYKLHSKFYLDEFMRTD